MPNPLAAEDCTPRKDVAGPFNIGGEEIRAVAIAIAPADLTRDSLRCLVAELKRKYTHPKALAFMIFDSRAALSRFTGISYERSAAHEAVIRHLYAIYYRNDREEYLTVKPIGSDGEGPLDSRMDLNANQASDCRVSIANRCLMALQQLVGPPSNTPLPDEVQLRARLETDGRLTHIDTVDRRLQGTSQVFARTVAENLKTWRFESEPGKGAIDVTVRAAVSNSVPSTGMVVNAEESGSGVSVRVVVGTIWTPR